MNHASRSRFVPVTIATALVLTGALAGCGGDNDDANGKKSGSPSASPTVIDGLTVPGLDLAFGEPATFEWKPTPEVTGKAQINVEKAQVAAIKEFSGYQLTEEMLASTPYFVTVNVKNTGKTDLGGKVLPLYLDNDGTTLYPSAVIPHFSECSPRALPEKFAAGESAKLCLIFLAPADTELRSIALLPDNGQEQIDWTGNVTDPSEKKPSDSASKSASSSPKPSETASN